jgi:hypothetical protein
MRADHPSGTPELGDHRGRLARQVGGSARVISGCVRHSASHHRQRYLRMASGPTLTGPACRTPRRQARASIPGGTGPSCQFRVRFARSVPQLGRKPEPQGLHRQHIEHAAGYAAASARLLLPLLHDFPDPGRFHRFPCSSPSDTLIPHECLFPGMRKRHLGRSAIKPGA